MITTQQETGGERVLIRREIENSTIGPLSILRPVQFAHLDLRTLGYSDGAMFVLDHKSKLIATDAF